MRLSHIVTGMAMLVGSVSCAAPAESHAFSPIELASDVQVRAAHWTRTISHTTVHKMASTVASLPLEQPTSPSFPGTPLPPPGTPCKKICSCTEGEQPAEGRVYCGFCWGVDSEGGMLWGTDVVKCSPGDCCNYGYLDGRCDVNDQTDAKKVREKYCPGGMLLRSKREAKMGIEGLAKKELIVNDDLASDGDGDVNTKLENKNAEKRMHIINHELEDQHEADATVIATPHIDHEPPACNPNCKCPSSKFPSEGQVYCGWCPLVNSTHEKPMSNQDKIVCTNSGCCNYGNKDKTCRGTGHFWPDRKYCLLLHSA